MNYYLNEYNTKGYITLTYIDLDFVYGWDHYEQDVSLRLRKKVLEEDFGEYIADNPEQFKTLEDALEDEGDFIDFIKERHQEEAVEKGQSGDWDI